MGEAFGLCMFTAAISQTKGVPTSDHD